MRDVLYLRLDDPVTLLVMDASAAMKPCVGCGAHFSAVEGPVHRYMESSPGCWAAYGEILVREYSDRTCYAVHRLSVDAYAVQHPGQPSPQSIQSVTIHLISLCFVFEHGFGMDQATAAMQQMAKTKARYRWLEPPPARGLTTVRELHDAKSAQKHVEAAWTWARDAWEAWAVHRDTIRGWANTRPAWK